MLTLVRGLPGGGKSTVARALAAAFDCPHVEPDQFRIVDGKYDYYSKTPEEIRVLTWAAVIAALDAEGSCVLSTCAERLEDVHYWKHLAATLDHDFCVVEAKGRHGSVHGSDDEVGVPRRVEIWEHWPVR